MTTPISRLAAARLTLGLIAVTFAGLLLPPSPAGAATLSVAVEDFDFSPASRTINVGDEVRWTFSGSSHSVTSHDGAFDSGIKDAGGSFEFTFTKPGTYAYFCIVHPSLMTGTIVVRSASATPKPTASPTATPTPSPRPTPRPTATARPTVKPTAKPTAAPTKAVASPSPSIAPSPSTTIEPSASPTSSQAIVEAPSPSNAPVAPSPSAPEPASASDSTPLILWGVLLVAILAGAGLLRARRRRSI